MRIDQIQTNEATQNVSVEKQRQAVSFPVPQPKVRETDILTGHAVQIKDPTYKKNNGAIEELKEKMTAEKDAVKSRQQEMAVLSNTLTPEDYQAYRENGYSLSDTDTGTVMTVVDKIKVKLAEAGVDVQGLSVSKDALKEFTGNAALAEQIEETLTNADLPVTEQNVSEINEALFLADSLKELSDGALRALLLGGEESGISAVYYAQNGNAGYTAGTLSDADMEALRPQIGEVLRQSALPENEKSYEFGRWLVANEVPLTVENVERLSDYKELSFPLEREKVLAATVNAIQEGKSPRDASLLSRDTLDYQAKEINRVVQEATDADVDRVLSADKEPTVEALAAAMNEREKEGAGAGAENAPSDTLAQIKAHRNLEEVRLLMTVEANRSLLKQGIEIDVKPLEELIEDLKAEEDRYASALLRANGGEAAPEEITAVKDTFAAFEELSDVPAYTLGLPAEEIETPQTMLAAGRALAERLNQAGEAFEPLYPGRTYFSAGAFDRYETMRTEVRNDLGDSIEKAFRNVDELLEELSLDTTEANRRAVRILGYNSMEITEESVFEVKAKDEEVQRTFRNLTPEVVTRLIRENKNPLDMDFETLNRTAEAWREENPQKEADSYGEFLYKLENNHKISEDERESYIGIFRLMHQVETLDNAAVGALLNQGTDLTMRNLMTMVRNRSRVGSTYDVDDDFDGVTLRQVTQNITDQVETGFDEYRDYAKNLMRDFTEELSPEGLRQVMEEDTDWQERSPEEILDRLRNADTVEEDKAYAESEVKDFSEAGSTESEVYRQLTQFDLPNTATNILAIRQMLLNPGAAHRKLFGMSDKKFRDENGEVDFDAIKNDLLEQFGEAVSEPEELAEAQRRLADVAENVMKTMLDSEEGLSSLDVRELKLMSTQLRLSAAQTKKQTYHIPVMVQGETGDMTLKIVSGKEKKGLVDIFFSNEALGNIHVDVKATDGRVRGMITAERAETSDRLRERLSELQGAWRAIDGVDTVMVSCIDHAGLNYMQTNALFDEEAEQLREEAPQATSTKTLYEIAKSFLSVLHTF